MVRKYIAKPTYFLHFSKKKIACCFCCILNKYYLYFCSFVNHAQFNIIDVFFSIEIFYLNNVYCFNIKGFGKFYRRCRCGDG